MINQEEPGIGILYSPFESETLVPGIFSEYLKKTSRELILITKEIKNNLITKIHLFIRNP